MPDKLKLHASERVDLNDLVHGVWTNTRDEFRFALLKLFQGQEPGGTIWDGFYIEKLDQSASPGQIRIVNGLALDRICEKLYKAPGTTLSPDNLFDDPDISRVITLPGISTTHYIEIEFVNTDGELDSRAFWDASFDNGADPSGDLKPDGKEVAEQVPTRYFPDWKVTTRVDTQFSWPDDLGLDGRTLKIPLATIDLSPSGWVTNTTEKANSTVLVDPDVSIGVEKVRVHNARLFQTDDILAFVGKDGTAKLNGAINEWAISSIDFVNNVITLFDDPTAASPSAVIATDSVQVVGNSTGNPREYVTEFRGFGTTNDAREKFFSELEINTGIDPEALVGDYLGLTPAGYDVENNSTSTGTTRSVSDEPFRTDTRIHTFKGLIRALEFVLSEMKHGVNFGNTQDGSTDYALESWVGTHAKAELSTDTENAPMGSLAEVGNARLYYPFGGTKRIQHTSLRTHVNAVRSHTITVGFTLNDSGDFYYPQGLANAMQFIYDNYSASNESGTLYIKNGQYRLNTVSYSNLSNPLELPNGWSIVGESFGGVEIFLPNNRRFILHTGTDGTVLSTQGQQLKNLMFVNDGVARDRSGVVIAVDADSVISSGIGRPLMKVDSCVFLNTDGGTTDVGDDLGFVRIAVDGTVSESDELQKRVIEFSNCNFVTDSANGQRHFEWSGKTSTGVSHSTQSVMPNVIFSNCQFNDLRNDTILGGGVRSATETASWIDVRSFGFVSTSNTAVFLQVTGCEFRSSRLFVNSGTISPVGGAIEFEDYLVGRLSVSGCSFMGFQWGIRVIHGVSSIQSCEFYQCTAGIVYGVDDNSINKTQVAGCNFNGAITPAAKGENVLAQSVGIMFAGAKYSHHYGAENTITSDPVSATTAKITGCNFSEIGCGISASALISLLTDTEDERVFIENFMVVGCTFYCIPGTAIDTGFRFSGGNFKENIVGSMFVRGCEFNWIMWSNHRDIFTLGQYPGTLILHQHQYAVSCFAARVFIESNTFNLVGLSGYLNGTLAYPTAGASVRRFLAVLGNDKRSATKTVVVKGNTFVGYSNIESGATTPNDHSSDTTNSKFQSWAGIFWMDGGVDTARDVGVSVSITNNTITGNYRVGTTGGELLAPDSSGQNGFWIAPAELETVSGVLSFKDNDFTFYRGQHGLYLSHDVGIGALSGEMNWNEIVISGNFIKSFDANASVSAQNGYPTTAAVGRVELIHIEGYFCSAIYSVDPDDGSPPDDPDNVNDTLGMPSIICIGNTLYIEGNTPTTGLLDFGLEDGQRAGILVTYAAASASSPNAVFRCNTFKNCSLTLGEDNSTEMAYRYIVEGNTFAGLITGTPGTTSGRFRGIFAHNHVHGKEDGGSALPLDESSMCIFSNNTVFNSTAIFRAGNSNANTWLASVIGYILRLTNNTFYGRGGGEWQDAVPVVAVRSCFDFMGGLNVTGGDTAFPDDGDNLEVWNSSVGEIHANKAIIVAHNIFPAGVLGQNCLYGDTNVTDVANEYTLVGAEATIGAADTTVGFIVTSNLTLNPTVSAPNQAFLEVAGSKIG